MFNLKKTEKKFLKCLNTAALAEKEKREDTKYILKVPPGLHFPINREIEELKIIIIREIAKEDPVKTNLPKKYIKEEVENTLFVVYNQPEAQRQDFLNKELLKLNEKIKNKLDEEMKDHTFTLHIDKLFLEEDFTIGNVSFYKLDESKAEEINAEEIEKHHAFVQSIMGGSSPLLKMGDTYAEVTTHGVQDYAYSLALYNIRLAMNVIKLFLDPEDCIFGLDGETVSRMHRKSFLSIDGKGPFTRAELVGGIPDYFLSKKDLEFMGEHGLDEISKIIQEDPSEYDKRLLTGIYWFGEAVSIITSNKDVGDGKRDTEIENFEFFNRGEKLLKLFTALESVFNFSKEEQITRNISERTAMILEDEYDKRIDIRKRIIRIYDDRSIAVHQGVTYVNEEDLSWLTGCVRGVLYKLIEFKKEHGFDSSKELCEYIEELILS